MIAAVVLLLPACEQDPAADDSGSPDSGGYALVWTHGDTVDGRWLDVSDSSVAELWALRDDGLVLAYGGAESYGATGAPFDEATLCTGLGPNWFWPPCVLSHGEVYYPNIGPFDTFDLPPGSGFLSHACGAAPNGFACDFPFTCAGGDGSGVCTALPSGTDAAGLAEAVVGANIITGSTGSIFVATDSEVFSWTNRSSTVDLVAVDLRSGSLPWALDEAGGVWRVDDDSTKLQVAADAVAISGGGLWQLRTGALWGTDVAYGDLTLQGPDLPGFATKLAGDVHRGCALIEHDLWCWTDADDLPFPGFVNPRP